MDQSCVRTEFAPISLTSSKPNFSPPWHHTSPLGWEFCSNQQIFDVWWPFVHLVINCLGGRGSRAK